MNTNYSVSLKHVRNPDISGGYWSPPVDKGTEKKVAVDSIESASAACRDYITRNDLGGGNWNGGNVFENGVYVGRISYNGRFWPVSHEYGKAA